MATVIANTLTAFPESRTMCSIPTIHSSSHVADSGKRVDSWSDLVEVGSLETLLVSGFGIRPPSVLQSPSPGLESHGTAYWKLEDGLTQACALDIKCLS